MSREPVLLLHGQPGGPRDWDRVIDAIGGRAWTIVAARPGSRGAAEPATGLAGNALAAAELLSSQGITRVTVAGHSFGAAVAAWLAATEPGLVSTLVLAAPAANRASLVWLDRLLAAPAVGPLTSAGLLGATGAALTAVGPARSLIARGLDLPEGYLGAAGRSLSSPRAWRSFTVEQRAMFDELPELERRLGLIEAPTTIVAGTADRIVPIASARALARQIPSAHLIELRGAGHMLPMRRADTLAELIVAAVGG